MEGEQHNTYDIEFYGPNTMMGTLYLGALTAARWRATWERPLRPRATRSWRELAAQTRRIAVERRVLCAAR
jgi:hypothetical protein